MVEPTPAGVWLTMLCLAGLATIIAFVVRLAQQRRDARRREHSRKAWEEREGAREQERFFAEVESYFPFVIDALTERIDAGEPFYDALVDALEKTPGVKIGTTFYGLPAVLPEAERAKILYLTGKTGSGKSTVLLSIIQADLNADAE